MGKLFGEGLVTTRQSHPVRMQKFLNNGMLGVFLPDWSPVVTHHPPMARPSQTTASTQTSPPSPASKRSQIPKFFDDALNIMKNHMRFSRSRVIQTLHPFPPPTPAPLHPRPRKRINLKSGLGQGLKGGDSSSHRHQGDRSSFSQHFLNYRNLNIGDDAGDDCILHKKSEIVQL